MSFLDELRNIPVTPPPRPAEPAEPLPSLGADNIRRACIQAQKSGKRSLDLVPAACWEASGDGDGGWMPPTYTDGFCRLMTPAELSAFPQQYLDELSRHRNRRTTDFTFTLASCWGEAPGHSSNGYQPYLFRLRASAETLYGRLRQDVAQLGFSADCVTVESFQNREYRIYLAMGLFSGSYKMKLLSEGEMRYYVALRLRW